MSISSLIIKSNKRSFVIVSNGVGLRLHNLILVKIHHLLFCCYEMQLKGGF